MAVGAVVEVILCRHQPGNWWMGAQYVEVFHHSVHNYFDVDSNAGHVQYRFPLGKFLQKDEVLAQDKQKKIECYLQIPSSKGVTIRP